MQTFLPYPSFTDSAAVLDRRRLGKQRVEALQILRALTTNPESRWASHPAVKMWRGYEVALADYGLAICLEWKERGYADTCAVKIITTVGASGLWPEGVIEEPPWLGDEAFHAAHRAALLAKDPEHYARFGWTEEPKIEYVWPVAEEVVP